jgi:hypothetical protein
LKPKNLVLYFTLSCLLMLTIITFGWTDVLNAAEITDITRINSRTNYDEGKTGWGIADLGIKEVNPFNQFNNSKIDTFLISAQIELVKTVGLNSSECAGETEIVVPAGTPVTYCFEITNTGTAELGLHDLVDDHLGVILDGLPFTLMPGASAFLTQTAVIETDTTNTATWTAYNPGPSDVAVATASASVWMPAPEIELVKTVGLNSSECAEETEIVVLPGTPVTYCFAITNSGNFTLGMHDLIDDHLGVILDGLPFTLMPGASVFLTQTAVIENDTTNTAIWTAYNPGPTDEVTATASASVWMPTPEVELVKTVGLSSSECAKESEIVVLPGTPVTYCFEITNTGTAELGLHDLIDDHLGVILDGLPYTLMPGASVFLTQTAVIETDTTNTATWTAYNLGPTDEVSATASASVWMPAPEIELVKTVGLNSSECAEETEIVVRPGTPVTYCFAITNSGNFTLGLHDLVDDHLGVILDGLPYTLMPGASVFLTQTAVIVTDTTNTATWTAYNLGPTDEVSATASATVNLPVEEYPLYLPVVIRTGMP